MRLCAAASNGANSIGAGCLRLARPRPRSMQSERAREKRNTGSKVSCSAGVIPELGVDLISGDTDTRARARCRRSRTVVVTRARLYGCLSGGGGSDRSGKSERERSRPAAASDRARYRLGDLRERSLVSRQRVGRASARPLPLIGAERAQSCCFTMAAHKAAR